MRQKRTKRQRIAIWVLSVLVVLSMVCGLIASVLPSGTSEGMLRLLQGPVASVAWLVCSL